MSPLSLMLLPLIAMIFLTFGVMMWMLKLRYRAVLKDGLNPKYFRLYRGAKIPDYLAKVTQHYENLLEMPPLFYLAVVLIITLGLTDTVYIILAWSYFATRLAHTFIHTRSNKLHIRKNIFIVSMLVLIVLWVKVLIDVVGL